MQTPRIPLLPRALFLCALSTGLVCPLAAQGLGAPPTPPGNPPTFDKIQLGQALFWDEQLSSTRSVACGSCHLPELGGIDPRTAALAPEARHPGADNSFGTGDDLLASPGLPLTAATGEPLFDAVFGMQRRVTPRRAPTVIDAAFAPELFWDGRAGAVFHDPISAAVVLSSNAALESLVAQPPVNEVEMGHLGRDWSEVVARIESIVPLALSPSLPPALEAWIAGRSYPQLFGAAFGSAEVSAAHTCMAIASYMRTLVADQTPFDRFLAGDTSAMTSLQQEGRLVFEVARCDVCHQGANLTAHEFKYTGVRPRSEDPGRFAVSGLMAERGAMKVPDLRNIALRAPYFHTGGKLDLDQVIDFYSIGGDFAVGNNDLIAAPIFGSNRVALLAYLEGALTDPRVAQGLPPFDHPALSEGTSRVPSPYGSATAGGAGVEPIMHAFEPSRLGTPDFTLAISAARGGALAALMLGLDQEAAGTPFFGATLFVRNQAGNRILRVQALEGAGQAAGWGSVSFALPGTPALAGLPLYAQWLVVDPHAGGQLSATEAVLIALF